MPLYTKGDVRIRYEEAGSGFPLLVVLSQSSIFGQNPKIGCQKFNDLQTLKLSKKQLCDRTRRALSTGSVWCP
jgi:hypothetical protein